MEYTIAIIAILSTIALPIAGGTIIWLTSVKNKHKERMGLVNQGIIPPDIPKRRATPNRILSLRNGIVLLSVGIGAITGLVIGKYLLGLDEDSMFWAFSASVVIFLGLGYLIYFFVSKKYSETAQNEESNQDL